MKPCIFLIFEKSVSSSTIPDRFFVLPNLVRSVLPVPCNNSPNELWEILELICAFMRAANPSFTLGEDK